jgi:TPR repeat protein
MPVKEAGSQPAMALRILADGGDPKAQNELGEAFFVGKLGVARDAVMAATWFRRAAEQGFAPAQSKLADCFERGDGVAKYEMKAYLWNLQAAAQGDERAKRSATRLELMLTPEEIAEGRKQASTWKPSAGTPASHSH